MVVPFSEISLCSTSDSNFDSSFEMEIADEGELLQL